MTRRQLIGALVAVPLAARPRPFFQLAGHGRITRIGQARRAMLRGPVWYGPTWHISGWSIEPGIDRLGYTFHELEWISRHVTLRLPT